MKILIVDDEPQIRDLLAWELEEHGFSVAMAGGVHDAIEVMNGGGIDVVVSDVRMPGGGGERILQHALSLKNNQPPVIFMTGYSDFSQFEAVERGAAAYFLKPFDIDKLVAFIKADLKIKTTKS